MKNTAVVSLIAAFLLAVGQSFADGTVGANQKINPFVNLRAADTGQTADIGFEYNPGQSFAYGGRATFVALKADPDKPPAEVSNEQANIGARFHFFIETGEKDRRIDGKQDAKVSRLGIALDARETAARYSFNPKGADSDTVWRHSWRAELRGWWFKSAGEARLISVEQKVAPTADRKPIAFESHAAIAIIQPQVRISYDRTWREADEVGVVRPPNDDGVQIAEKLRIEPPSLSPSASVLVAVACEPSKGRFAYAPAIRFTSRGASSAWDPTGKVGRLRGEFWVYFFAFNDGPATRIGVAPFADVRTGGTDKREDFVAGGVIELRVGTSRLEY